MNNFEQELQGYLSSIHQAWIHKDRESLLQFFHTESYSELGGFGPYRIWGKEQLAEHMRAYLEGEQTVAYYRIREPLFQCLGDVGIITYYFEMGVREAGTLRQSTGKETHVVCRTAHGLRVVHIHWSLNNP